jgi:hypothetical protein
VSPCPHARCPLRLEGSSSRRRNSRVLRPTLLLPLTARPPAPPPPPALRAAPPAPTGALKQPTGEELYDDERGEYVAQRHWYESKAEAVIEVLEDKDPEEKVGQGWWCGGGPLVMGGFPFQVGVWLGRGSLAVLPSHACPLAARHPPRLTCCSRPSHPTSPRVQVLIFSEFPDTLRAIKNRLPTIGLQSRNLIGASSAGGCRAARAHAQPAPPQRSPV